MGVDNIGNMSQEYNNMIQNLNVILAIFYCLKTNPS